MANSTSTYTHCQTTWLRCSGTSLRPRLIYEVTSRFTKTSYRRSGGGKPPWAIDSWLPMHATRAHEWRGVNGIEEPESFTFNICATAAFLHLFQDSSSMAIQTLSTFCRHASSLRNAIPFVADRLNLQALAMCVNFYLIAHS